MRLQKHLGRTRLQNCNTLSRRPYLKFCLNRRTPYCIFENCILSSLKERVSTVHPLTRIPCGLPAASTRISCLAVLGGLLGETWRTKHMWKRLEGKEFERGKGRKGKRLGTLPYGQNQSSFWMDKERNKCVSSPQGPDNV